MAIKLDTQEKKMNTVLWMATIAFSAFLGIGALQLISFGQVREQTSTNTTDILRIQKDYLPYFAFEYIVESNQKLMNLVSAIESKDDKRYQESVREWSDLQQRVVNQAAKNKIRSGNSTTIGGG